MCEEWKVKENWDSFIAKVWSDSNANKPEDKLKSVLKHLSNLEECDYIDQWDEVRYADESRKCACGHDTDYTFLVRNYVTENVIAVGLDCLKKHFITTAVEQGRIIKKELVGGESRICCACLKRNIPFTSAHYVDRCKKCFATQQPPCNGYKMLKYLPCEDCDSKEISPTTPNRKKCLDCYNIYKTYMKECEKCGKNAIPLAYNTTICMDCKNSGDMRECPQCKLMKIPVADGWRKTCGSCWYKNKK